MKKKIPARSNEVADNPVTSHLFSDRRPDTAFQRYRNSRLAGEFHSEITGRSLAECLDECLRQASFQCRSAVYSDRFRTCRLSRFNQKDGYRIIYDADYDYYENLMSEYQSMPKNVCSLCRVSFVALSLFVFVCWTHQSCPVLCFVFRRWQQARGW